MGWKSVISLCAAAVLAWPALAQPPALRPAPASSARSCCADRSLCDDTSCCGCCSHVDGASSDHDGPAPCDGCDCAQCPYATTTASAVGPLALTHPTPLLALCRQGERPEGVLITLPDAPPAEDFNPPRA